MSVMITHPEALAAAAGQLNCIGSVMAARNAAAAGPTTGLSPAAADEVSTLTAMQFNLHAAMYQAVGAHAIAVHDLFTAILGVSAGSYAATEAANTVATG